MSRHTTLKYNEKWLLIVCYGIPKHLLNYPDVYNRLYKYPPHILSHSIYYVYCSITHPIPICLFTSSSIVLPSWTIAIKIYYLRVKELTRKWQMNRQIVILVAFDRQISRSIALLFCPVLSRSLPGDCKFLLIFTRYPVRKPNVDSRKSPGEKKEKSKVFERSQRFLRRGGWPRDKWSRISMRLLWSSREACVLETIPPRLPTWTLAPCRLWVIPLMVLLWKEQEKDCRGSKTRID